MYGLGGGPEPYFFETWPLPLTVWVFLTCSGPVSDNTALHPYPHYSNIWAYEGQVIWVDLLHLMCRRHVQHGSPQYPNMLEILTDNDLGHPGDSWCNLQHQAHQSARNQRWQNFSNRLSSWDMRPQYLDSACQNASTYLLSLSSNSTICRVRGAACSPKTLKRREVWSRHSKIWSPNPPLPRTFLKRAFLTNFKKYTHPLQNENLVHWTKSSENPKKLRIWSVLAYYGCPRETYIYPLIYTPLPNSRWLHNLALRYVRSV